MLKMKIAAHTINMALLAAGCLLPFVAIGDDTPVDYDIIPRELADNAVLLR